ncbi:MAG TPA: protein kinase, partial [Candidatus Xenobia bacterium]
MADFLTPDDKVYDPVALIKEDRSRTVSRVVEQATGRPLVAHQLHVPGALADAEVQRRLTQGAAALQRVRHPRIAACLGYQHTPTGDWLLCEAVEGYPLGSYDEAECQDIPDEWVVLWLHQMLELLEEVHGAGQVVGGLRPDHFLVTGHDLHLVHLGLMENLFPDTMALTRSAERLAFTAPEHQHSVLISTAGDLYSVGAIAWWLAIGSPPPLSPPLDRHTAEMLIMTSRPSLEPEAVSALVQLLSFQAGERFSTASEARLALVPFLTTVTADTRPPPTPADMRGAATAQRSTQEADPVEIRADPPLPRQELGAVEAGSEPPPPPGRLDVSTAKRRPPAGAAPAAHTRGDTAVMSSSALEAETLTRRRTAAESPPEPELEAEEEGDRPLDPPP